MKIQVDHDIILPALNLLVGVVERKQTLAVLANFLLRVEKDQLILTATDMELEMTARLPAQVDKTGITTVPARKLFDICRALPEGSTIKMAFEDDRLTASCGRSRFTLSTLPADEFPSPIQVEELHDWNLPDRDLRALLERSAFAMGHQDVRYYLNGLLLELGEGRLRAVATDGHRMVISDLSDARFTGDLSQAIVPRKAVIEIQRMLDGGDGEVQLGVAKNHLHLVKNHLVLTSKLIDARYPDYEAVLPLGNDKLIQADRRVLHDALYRASILSNEKYRGVRMDFSPGSIRIIAHNPQHEEAVDEIEADHALDKLSVGFNVIYLMDALQALEGNMVQIALRDANSSCLLTESGSEQTRHVIMPLKL